MEKPSFESRQGDILMDGSQSISSTIIKVNFEQLEASDCHSLALISTVVGVQLLPRCQFCKRSSNNSTTRNYSSGGYSPFDLDGQYWQFVQFIYRSQIRKRAGGVYGDSMPKEEYLRKALYKPCTHLISVRTISDKHLQKIYNLGARSFWIHNTGPIGCLLYILEYLLVPADQIDNAGCGRPYNDVTQYFNHKVKEAIAQLGKDILLAAITYVDAYSVKCSLFVKPKKYGFELPHVACCGFGGQYSGSMITFDNGTQLFVGSCARSWARVNWDRGHYTDTANKFVFDRISSGEFSDPPSSLRMACRKR